MLKYLDTVFSYPDFLLILQFNTFLVHLFFPPRYFIVVLACEWVYQLLQVHKNTFLAIPKRSLIMPLCPSSSLGGLLSHGPFSSSGCGGLLLCCWARDSPHSPLSNRRDAVCYGTPLLGFPQ